MTGGLEVLTEPLGGSPLSLAAQSGDLPGDWYAPRPVFAHEWAAHARRVAGAFHGGGWAEALAPALSASRAAAERIERTVAGGGVVVTTGQQPGLFGGPVYTWTKALTALAIADEVESRTGVPAAPVFWAATDDADFAEARWTMVALADEAVRLELRDEPAPGTPMSDARLGSVAVELEQLERAAGSAAFRAPLEAARNAYREGGTVGGAYVALLRELLEPLGIAVLDASNPSVRREGGRLLGAALETATAVAAKLRERAVQLRAAGFEPQVADELELSLVFDMTAGRKRRIPLDEAARAASARGPELLAPNVLLRPILERAILPTVAYAAGPAELAYFAQVSAVADALGVDRPVVVPRWSATIIEPPVARIVERLHIRYTDVRDPHALEGRLAGAALPEPVMRALARIRDAIEEATGDLAAERDARVIPPAALGGAKASLLDRLRRLERRYTAAMKRREAEVMRQIATVRAHLYPAGKRQERALNFLPILARSGQPLLDMMRRGAADHARRVVDGNGAPAADLAPARGETTRRRGARQ